MNVIYIGLTKLDATIVCCPRTLATSSGWRALKYPIGWVTSRENRALLSWVLLWVYGLDTDHLAVNGADADVNESTNHQPACVKLIDI